MAHTSTLEGRRPSPTPRLTGTPRLTTRLTPQFWHYGSPPSVIPNEGYAPSMSGASVVMRRRISSDFKRRPSHHDVSMYQRMNDPRVEHMGSHMGTTTSYLWPTNGSSNWIPPTGSTSLNPIHQCTGFSSFGPSVQSEFIRSYNRTIQTYCIIASFLYYYPVSAPLIQQSDGQLTDFWVDEATTTSNAAVGDDTSTMSHDFIESPESASGVRIPPTSDRTQSSTITTALTGSSRTRSPSPDKNDNLVLSTTRQRRLRDIGSDVSSSTHLPMTAASAGTLSEGISSQRLKSDSSQALAKVAQLGAARSETEFHRSRSLNEFLQAARGPWGFWRSHQCHHPLLRNAVVPMPFWTTQMLTRKPFLLLRPSRFDVLRAMWIDTATTTIQRHWRGHLGRRRAAAERQWEEWKTKATRSAVRIQRHVRSFLNRLRDEQEQIYRIITVGRQTAALTIQRCWKAKKRREAAALEAVVAQVRRLRHESAIAIQRHYRGYKIRKLVDLEYKRWVVTWRWDPAGKVVELVGSFTTPPWTSRILMSWDPMSRQYAVDLPRIPGRHEMKFVVDGDFCCDGSLTVISDGAGHYNNVVVISPTSAESPLKRLRDRVRLRELRADPLFVESNTHKTIGRLRSSSVKERLRHDSFKESPTKRSNSTADTLKAQQPSPNDSQPSKSSSSRARRRPRFASDGSIRESSRQEPTGTPHSIIDNNRNTNGRQSHVALNNCISDRLLIPSQYHHESTNHDPYNSCHYHEDGREDFNRDSGTDHCSVNSRQYLHGSCSGYDPFLSLPTVSNPHHTLELPIVPRQNLSLDHHSHDRPYLVNSSSTLDHDPTTPSLVLHRTYNSDIPIYHNNSSTYHNHHHHPNNQPFLIQSSSSSSSFSPSILTSDIPPLHHLSNDTSIMSQPYFAIAGPGPPHHHSNHEAHFSHPSS